MIVFIPRFNLKYISKESPSHIKKEYRKILSKAGIEDKDILETKIDKEDWIESIIPLLSLEKHSLDYHILSQSIKEIPMPKKIILVGIYMRLNQLKREFESFETVEEIMFPGNLKELDQHKLYAESEVFKKYANRKIFDIVATVDIDTFREFEKNKESLNNHQKEIYEFTLKLKPHALENKLSKLSFEQDEEEKTYFLKTVEKKWALPVKVKKESTPNDIWEVMVKLLDYEWIMRLNNKEKAILIQDFAEIEYEYRLIVINGKLIGGAGCIEEFTPVDNLNDDYFDSQVKQYRKTKCEIERRYDIIESFKDFAETFVKEYKPGETYILDIGFINGDIGVIEINPFLNYGFYALNYDSVIRHIKENILKG